MARRESTPPLVRFYQLAATPLAEAVARIANKIFDLGLRACILTRDGREARELDEFLWRYPADRFLPHVVGTTEDPELQPVIIDTAPNDQNGATVLINAGQRTDLDPAAFDTVVEFVVTAQLAESRERYRSYREQGCRMEYLVQTPQGWRKQ